MYVSYNPYKSYELSYQLANAVKEHKDTVLKGLGAMDDDEKERRIAEFKKAHMPDENATPEQLEEFRQKLALYIQSLERVADRERAESMINVGGVADDDCDITPTHVKMYQKMIMTE